MNTKNEVFEYLIDQLRQQLPIVDVMGEIKRWSIDRSIAGRGNYTDEENALIDAYVGLEHNPYKQQCEDLAHEVQSLKNQLRDASAQIKELHLALVKATGDVEAYKLIREQEQSGCRKEDAQAGESWIECDGCGARPVPDDTVVDIKFRSGEVESNTKALWWSWGATGGLYDIVAYRVVKQQRRKEDAQGCSHNWRFVGGKAPAVCVNCGVAKSDECEHKWEYYYPNGRRCAKCGAINV